MYQPNSYWPALHDRNPGALTAVGYPALGEGFNKVTYWRRRRAVASIVRRVGLWQPRVLEGAVGVGAYAPVWAQLGVQQWLGLDIAGSALERLRHRYDAHQFFEIDLASRDEERWRVVEAAGRFDLVCGIDVLYHMTSDESFTTALGNLARFVKPGGILLISDVFTANPVQVAPHVRRRPISSYESILGPMGFQEATREPVFSVLGDPVPRIEARVSGAVLSFTWRMTQKLIRETPPALRSPLGAVLAWGLMPVDWALRKAGVARGVNLELAAFRRLEK
jgi:SAM-dependent methyltransferase